MSERTVESVVNNPNASSAEIFWLNSQGRGALAVQHPQCPESLWWELARYHPLEAVRSPLHPLMLLENPAAWLDMELRCAWQWVNKVLERNQLVPARQWQWGADCAEHVLPLFRSDIPRDLTLLNDAIVAIREFGRGEIDQDELRHVSQLIKAMLRMPQTWAGTVSRLVASTVLEAAQRDPVVVASRAQDAVHAALIQQNYQPPMKESVWQWRRLLWYIEAE